MTENSEPTGCLGFILKALGISPSFKSGVGKGGRQELPYRLRKNFLSAAELAFYRVLEQAVGQTYSINNKVRLWDLLYVPRQDNSRSYENKISSKHVDFLLCDSVTMQPILAIELDDSSHDRKERKDRDAFVDQAYTAAGLAVLHVRAARTYSVAEVINQITEALPKQSLAESGAAVVDNNNPPCPKCNTPMVQRKAGRGKHAGKRFWACSNYPKCREIIGID